MKSSSSNLNLSILLSFLAPLVLVLFSFSLFRHCLFFIRFTIGCLIMDIQRQCFQTQFLSMIIQKLSHNRYLTILDLEKQAKKRSYNNYKIPTTITIITIIIIIILIRLLSLMIMREVHPQIVNFLHPQIVNFLPQISRIATFLIENCTYPFQTTNPIHYRQHYPLLCNLCPFPL